MDNLPEQQQNSIPLVLQPRRKFFPSIYRFIPEFAAEYNIWRFIKVSISSFITCFILLQIVLQSMQLVQNIEQLEKIKQKRMVLIQQVTALKLMENRYSGYRDIYYRIAALQYSLGNFEDSKKYIKKALEIDPNYKEVRVLGEKVGL